MIEDRVHAVIDFGFTDRQARFLVHVMRHAGVCVPRQFARLSGIANGGKKCNAFFAKLVRRGHATPIDCVHNRARLYHVHSKALYHAIGEPNSRHRRALAPRQVLERLMVLDAVLDSPDLNWLTVDAEKAAYFTAPTVTTANETSAVSPAIAYPTNRIEFGSTFPIGIDSTGGAVLLYITTVPWTDAFRRFLHEHVCLLRTTTHWTVRLVFPRPLDRFYDGYQAVVRDELETLLPSARINELKWYFRTARRPRRFLQMP
jgi:hypothetical protein